MSAAALIDGLEFAHALQELHGTLAVASLQRLEDVLFDTQGSLDYELRGARDERNRPRLELTVEGPLHLQCQRCLARLDYEVEVSGTLLVVPKGTPIDEDMDDPEAPDVLEVEGELDVEALVEDEVLLSLPLAPRHPEGQCPSRVAQSEAAAERPNAFAQLAALKRTSPPNKR